MEDLDMYYSSSFLKGTIKTADVDIDPYEEHDKTESRTDETGENIPFTPVGESNWEPEREQETSFRGESQRASLMNDDVKDLY